MIRSLVEFVKVHVLKPVTSKPGNSEVYIVAECFKTLDDQLLSVLKSHIGLSVAPLLLCLLFYF